VVELMRTAGATVLDMTRQNQSFLVPEASGSVLKRRGMTQEQCDRFARLGVRSAIVVPIALAERVVGALALLATHRNFADDDLTLAEDVGERVAAAVENARLYQAARDALRARDDFLVLAAHELRTPLAALKLVVDKSLRDGPRASQTGGPPESESIARQVKRLSRLVEHMLDACRIRAEGITLKLGACDLGAIARERVNASEDRARRAGSTIAVSGASSVVGRWDQARLAQLVDALVDNAIKFAGGKPIEVDVGRNGTQALLTVRDHGMGIPAERMNSLFSPFGRTVSKEQFGGLGLGLYVAREIAQAHGGSIDVTSHLEEGTTFVVRLPLEQG
jgi:signal transduction histidine kinase